ncbi:biotin carboxylase N-terminal domain-containing protein [Nonomuraea rosea]|uniref:Biotin carboxylase N-terminal domain-containing protein n=1 Tax=Nonomuraea rosea TaxID=638574 RepID=A0ABP6X4T1_9ACTN
MPGISRLAIVNRGEPAIRVLDAVAELNRDGATPRMTTIVLYTDLDSDAWYTRMADEAVSLGAATCLDPQNGHRRSAYLDEERVMRAVTAAHADAVWVGWGFLAEHASFAQLCEEAGITFIGPHSTTIRLLGDKIAAKVLAEKAGVPVVPWSGAPVADPAAAAQHADLLGYPVVVKAAMGGGGRGIRVVHAPEELASALAAARVEAQAAFGDPAVFIERLVERARHVEVQIISDAYGATWAVGVRDCSVQRRNQKVIEESGSTALTPQTEHALLDAAVRLAGEAGYQNAGTVEFLVDPDTGAYLFMEVNTRLQVEHPVTEETTGTDLVKLQLHVARGGHLIGGPPPARGCAMEARLCAEDPEHGFVPAPGRVAVWRPAGGPGIRVDAGVAEGDTVAPEFDSMIAKIVAWGADRNEALARLRRALAATRVVIEGGTTNRAFLLSLLALEEMRRGTADNRWLDRLTAGAGHLPAADPIAVLQAAIEAYDADHEAERAAFHEAAGRGRPEVSEEIGRRARLRYRGRRYELRVLRTGPEEYRVETGGGPVDVGVRRLGAFERRLACGGSAYRTQISQQGPAYQVEVERDGEWAAHRVHRDDGGIVRAAHPAFVVSVLVTPGDQVAEGDPLVVLESMKLESTLTAPYAGEVASVEAAVNTQVVTGQPLLRIRETEQRAAGPGTFVSFDALCRQDTTPTGYREVYAALSGCLLGFDLDPREIPRQQRTEPGGDPGLPACEEAFLELFADVSALYRPQPEPEEPEAASAQEYLLSYLQWLDPDRAGLTPGFRTRLERVLARYGVAGLDRTPQLEEAVVWMFRAFRRAHELVPAVAAVLERRLRHRDLAPPGRELMARLAGAAQVRHPVVADLARDVLFRYFDEPQHERAVAAVYAEMEGHLDALAADPDRQDRDDLIDRLVWCPQPMRGPLLARWQSSGTATRRVAAEVYIRRFYRTRPIEHVGWDGALGTAGFEHDGVPYHLVVAYTSLDDVRAACAGIARHLADVAPTRQVIAELITWRPGKRTAADTTQAEVAGLLTGVNFGRWLERLFVTVTSERGDGPEHHRTQHFAYLHTTAGFEEEPLYRNLHPMIAERAELWRLSNFTLERLRSAEDVYLFRGVAKDNPADVRLFAIGEVRDLTPVRDRDGHVVSLPQLERLGLQALCALREHLAAAPPERRPQPNRIILCVRPPFDVPREDWLRLARPFVPLAAGASLDKLLLQVRIPVPGGAPAPAVLHVEGLDEDHVTVRQAPYGRSPIRPLTEYGRKVLRARRFGAPYPYQIVRMLAPAEHAPGDFPPGTFTEHDLAEDGTLRPVTRTEGRNTANLVVGVIANRTAKVPEGMARVAILGDPTRSLGALAEPECRRIIAALDLAERMRVPVEWFALSSGARIAMDSGTENMDWIAAVLRRLIEFTQRGGEVNVVVTGVNVGAQPYWNAESTMLLHTRGILVMVAGSAMVLTGKQALDFSGGVSADDNTGIGGYERIMGPNGQAQYGAANLAEAGRILMRHYEHAYVVPGERHPRTRPTSDPPDRDVRDASHPGPDFHTVGEIFSAEHNAERKKPFDIRSVMRAVCDTDAEPLERWARWRDAETAVVWDAHIGGFPVCVIGLESAPQPRHGFVPADGPPAWTAGTLFPQSSRKVARAINAASGNRPIVVLANLSGFDGSPESMRRWQLEYGAEIGRAVTNFAGPMVFVVISRYHGGAFVVFSKRLNPRLEIAAVEGSYASVIGGAPAAAVVFVREVGARTERDPRVTAARESGPLSRLVEITQEVRAEKLREVAAEFDRVHSIQRALDVGSVDRVIPAAGLRPYVIDALQRGLAGTG